jgi:HEAT repeat protein
MQTLLPLWGFLGALCVAVAIIGAYRGMQAVSAARRKRPLMELLPSLEHPKPMKRIRAAEALGERSGDDAAAAVEALVKRLDDPEPEVRAVVVNALGRLKDGRAADALRSHLDDASPEVRGLTVSALVDLSDFAALPEIVELLDDEEWTIRVWTAAEIVRLGREASLDALLEARDREVWRAHVRLCETGVRIVDERAVSPLLVEMRNAKDPGIRAEAALALSSFGHVPGEESRIVECLTAATEDESPHIRFLAVVALGEQTFAVEENYDRALRTLERASHRDANKLVAAAARRALPNFTIERRRMVRRLAERRSKGAADDASPIRVDMHTFQMLVDELHNADAPLRWRFAHALAMARNREATAPLCAATKDDDWRVRAASVRALGVIGDPTARGALERAAIEDEHVSVREAAERALTSWNA